MNNFMLYIYIFLHSIIPSILSTRSDYSPSALQLSPNTLKGNACTGISADTANPVWCPDNTWAYGFRLMTISSYGIINIILDCRSQTYDSPNLMWSYTTSTNVSYTNIGSTFTGLTKIYSNWLYCNGDNGRDYITGYYLREWCPSSGSSQGIVEVKLQCSYGNILINNIVTTHPTASWTSYSYCSSGYAVCGYELYFQQTPTYNYGSVDINLKCCMICDIANGNYYNTLTANCKLCDINCMQCYGTSTYCTQCFSGYTLSSSNTCITGVLITIADSEFFTTYGSTGWTTNSVHGIPLNSCSQYLYVGGYNGFSQNDWLAKTISGLAAHSMIRIRFRFYKIGVLSDGFCLVYIDGVLTNLCTSSGTTTPLFYGENCGNGNLLMNTQIVDTLMSHSNSSIAFKVTTNMTNAAGIWAISHFLVETYSCDVTCNTCSGIGANQCTSCSITFLTASSTCISTCTFPFFGDSTTYTCVLTCTASYYGNPLTRNCESTCPNNYFINPTDRICYQPCPSASSLYGNPLTGYCVTTCPTGMYQDTTTRICLYCDFNCATCTTTATNCGSCKYSWLTGTTCFNPTNIQNKENDIFKTSSVSNSDFTASSWSISNPYSTTNTVSICGSYNMVGGYLILGMNAILSKSYTGLSAHLYSRITCYVMKIGNWNANNINLYVDSVIVNTLTFTSTTDSSAYKICGSTSQNEALRQIDVYFSHSATTLSVSFQSDLAIDATQASWGIFDLTITLFLCDSSCKSCSLINDATHCLSCFTGTYLQTSPGPSTCLTTCPSNKYKDTTNNLCLPCDTSCLTCQADTSTSCLSCSSTYLLYATGPTSCGSCLSNYYQNDANMTCLPCDSSCATCSTSGSTNCKTCLSGNYLQDPTATVSSCQNTCPDGKYPSSTTNKCLLCDITCSTCSQSGLNYCKACPVNTFLQSSPGPSNCLSQCPSGYYKDMTNWICSLCDTTCNTCSAAGSSACSSCLLPLILQSFTGPSTCLSSCPSGYFQYTSNNTCLHCDISCLTCQQTAMDQCLSCANNLYLQPAIGPALCLSTCPLRTYKYTINYTCLPCDSTCLTCIGSSASQCLTCDTGIVLSSVSPAQCVNFCADGYYFNSVSSVCNRCDSSCKTCIAGDASSCTACNSTSFLQAPTPPSSCDSSCPFGLYPVITNNTCQYCDNTCLNCSTTGLKSCTSCNAGSFLYGSPPNYCKSSCPSGYFADNTTNLCELCDSSCKECKNSSVNGCTSCLSGYYLQGSNALKTNSSGTCVIIPMITPVLKPTTHPLEYLMVFSSNYSHIYSLYTNKTTIIIDGISNSTFKFNLTAVEDTDIYIIDFDLNFSITNYPLMHVYLNLPDSLITTYDIQLSTYVLTTKMLYYYYLDSDTKKLINETTQATNMLNDVVSNTFIANNILSAGSGIMFQCLTAMDAIRFLRYFEVNYPENVLSIFRANLPFADIIPNIVLDERTEDGSIPDIFKNYSVSIYIFNNIGNTLIEAANYYVMGIFAWMLVHCFKNYKNRYFKVFLILIAVVFIWGYALSNFLANYMNFSFYTLLAYRFPTTGSKMGYFNIFFSLFVGIFIIIIFPFIIVKIRKIAPKILKKGDSSSSSVHQAPDGEGESVLGGGSISEKRLCQRNDRKSQNLDITLSKNVNKVDDKLIIENLDTPSMMSPNDKRVLTREDTGFKSKVTSSLKKASKFFTNFRKSIMQMSKAEDYPFDWRKSMKTLVSKISFSANQTKDLDKSNFKPLEASNIDKGHSKELQEEVGTTPPPNCVDANRYGSLHKDYKHESLWQSYFIIWMLLKQLLYCMIIAASFDKPFSGLILTAVLDGLYILSLVIINPLKECKQLLQNLFNETCGLIATIIALYMAYMDRNDIVDEDLKLKLGWGIVLVNILLIVVFLLRMVIAWCFIFYELGKELCKTCKKRCKKNKVGNEGEIEDKNIDPGVLDKILEMDNFLR